MQLNGPVSLVRHLVQPGDYVVADIDGVCVIPFFDVPRVVEHCENATATEAAFIDRIDAAATLEELVAGLTRARPGVTADVTSSKEHILSSTMHDPPAHLLARRPLRPRRGHRST